MARDAVAHVPARAVIRRGFRSIAMSCTVVTIVDKVADPEVFDGWVRDVRSAAQAAGGFVALAASSRHDTALDRSSPRTCSTIGLLLIW
jgi:hypothetical protein